MKKEHWTRIHHEVVAACTALFEANGVELVVEDAALTTASPAPSIAASVEFAGDQIAGHLSLVVPASVVRRSYPVRDGSDAEDAAQRDWVCELTNQLLGRLKMRLRALRLIIQPSMPRAADGTALCAHEPKGEGFRAFGLGAGSDHLCLLFDAVARDAIAIASGPPDMGGWCEPGEGFLF
jgi:hypothetical protein